jgi:hypothetical protein
MTLYSLFLLYVNLFILFRKRIIINKEGIEYQDISYAIKTKWENIKIISKRPNHWRYKGIYLFKEAEIIRRLPFQLIDLFYIPLAELGNESTHEELSDLIDEINPSLLVESE